MLETGALVGGEQSGHVLFLDRATTGDGLVTAMELVNVILETGRPLEDLGAPFIRYPQILRNVRVANPGRWGNDPEIAKAAARAEQRLTDRGRVLIRASGTEPLVRVMVEHEDAETAESIARELCDVIGRRLGGATISLAVPEGETAGGGP
jgi:phosphoglucosamine mutase